MADASQDPGAPGRPGTPRWVKILGLGIVAAVVVVAAVMLTAGGEHGPGMHAGSDGGASPAPDTSGLAGDGGVGAPAGADEAVRTVEIKTLDALAFEPASISVSAGEAVTFVVSNTGQTVHEFTLGDAAMQVEHANAMGHMPAGMAHELANSITLQPGETKQLTWRFGGAGSLEYACHEPGHYEGGMRGRIAVG